MKIICSQKDLKNALGAASRALPAKPQTPILNGIYFSARENTLEMQATDFSLGIIAKIPAEIEVEGEIVINGKNITEIINKMSGDIITLEVVDQTVTVRSDAAKFTLYTMEIQDFPKIGTQEYTNSFLIKNNTLKDLIGRSLFACADDNDARAIFKGCSITIEDSEITFVATNTHRLIVISGEIEDEIPNKNALIVPADALREVLGILNALQDDRGVKVEFSDKHISFALNNILVNCRLIDGTFPAHDKLIPKEFLTTAQVEVEDFLSAINRVEIISRATEYNTTKFKFDEEGFTISAESYTAGKVYEHLNAQIEGQSLEISFNLKYIQEFLRFVRSNHSVTIKMNESLSPAILSLAEDTNIIYVVTPVRTQ